MSPYPTQLKFIMVDTFTRTPFEGCRVAVCILSQAQHHVFDELRLAKIRDEIGAPETVFAVKTGDKAVRLLSDPAGSPTGGASSLSAILATAHVLWSEGHAGHVAPLTLTEGVDSFRVTKRSDHIAIETPVRVDKCRVIELSTPAQFASYRPIDDVSEDVSDAVDHLLVTVRTEGSLADFLMRAFVRHNSNRELTTIASTLAHLGTHWLERLPGETRLGELRCGERVAKVHFERHETPSVVVIAGQAVTTLKGLFTVAP